MMDIARVQHLAVETDERLARGIQSYPFKGRAPGVATNQLDMESLSAICAIIFWLFAMAGHLPSNMAYYGGSIRFRLDFKHVTADLAG